MSCPPLPAGSLEVHLSLQLGSAREAPSAGQVPCSRWLQKTDAHGQQLGLARAWWFLHVPEMMSSSRPRCAGCPGVRDPSRGGRGHQSRGGWALCLSSRLRSTPLSPPQEALFVKLGRACTFALGEFFCTRGRDLGTLAMRNKYCGRKRHGKQKPTTLKFLLFSHELPTRLPAF